MKQKVLFIRVTEKCNANCFMCDYAGNKIGHNLSVEELLNILKWLKKYNFKLIRFTGGEPLLNANLSKFIKILNKENFYTSVITNGLLLLKKLDDLASAGLDQIVVSIDGDNDKLNDELRGITGIFDMAIKGIKKCKSEYPNIHVRVNTVVSNKNIDRLCNMSDLFLSLGVDEWSLTPIKEDYNCFSGLEEKYINIYKSFIDYVETHPTPRLIGFSKYWGGRTKQEINDLFYNNIHYTPNTKCELVNRVAFYIPSKKLLLPCNSFAHRLEEVGTFINEDLNMLDKYEKMSEWFNSCCQKKCKGCSPINTYLAENPNIIDDDIWGF